MGWGATDIRQHTVFILCVLIPVKLRNSWLYSCMVQIKQKLPARWFE